MKYLILAIFFIPLFTSAQRIKINKYDTSLNTTVIETTSSQIKQGFSISFKAIGPNIFATLKGIASSKTASSLDNEVNFLLENDSTVKAVTTSLQSDVAGMNGIVTSSNDYSISYNDLELLSQFYVLAIMKGTTDVYVPKNKQTEIRMMSLLLKSDMAKAKVLENPNAVVQAKPVNPEKTTVKEMVAVSKKVPLKDSLAAIKAIKLEEIANHVGERVKVCGRVYTARYLSNSKTRPTILNIGAPYPNQLLSVTIPEEDRGVFGQDPEFFFVNKDVCITGEVTLFNNKPEIVVHNKEQLTLSNEVTKGF